MSEVHNVDSLKLQNMVSLRDGLSDIMLFQHAFVTMFVCYVPDKVHCCIFPRMSDKRSLIFEVKVPR
jgi:hypothetical protein